MSFSHKPPRYRTFLLTLWEERNREKDSVAVWRFRLEDPHTGDRYGFATLEALVTALKQEMNGNEEKRSEKRTSFALERRKKNN